MNLELLQHLKQHPSFKVVVLTGAGISAESGISTFRDANGLWENHSIEEVATPEGFAANPSLVHRFYNQRRSQLLNGQVKPNAAHMALAKLEKALGERFNLITQNVDNLHELAGNKRLIHMHGELLWAKCRQTGSRYSIKHDLNEESMCQCCQPTPRYRLVW